ncbi:MAG TPA: hypothetical protein PKJ23_13140 [bacterium]|nr:hypothetical protein [bacterium]
MGGIETLPQCSFPAKPCHVARVLAFMQGHVVISDKRYQKKLHYETFCEKNKGLSGMEGGFVDRVRRCVSTCYGQHRLSIEFVDDIGISYACNLTAVRRLFSCRGYVKLNNAGTSLSFRPYKKIGGTAEGDPVVIFLPFLIDPHHTHVMTVSLPFPTSTFDSGVLCE